MSEVGNDRDCGWTGFGLNVTTSFQRHVERLRGLHGKDVASPFLRQRSTWIGCCFYRCLLHHKTTSKGYHRRTEMVKI